VLVLTRTRGPFHKEFRQILVISLVLKSLVEQILALFIGNSALQHMIYLTYDLYNDVIALGKRNLIVKN